MRTLTGTIEGKELVSEAGGLPDLTGDQYRTTVEKLLLGNTFDLLLIIEDPKSLNFQRVIANVLYNAMLEGNIDVLEQLVESVIGKIPEQNEPEHSAINVRDIDDKELIERLRRLNEEI